MPPPFAIFPPGRLTDDRADDGPQGYRAPGQSSGQPGTPGPAGFCRRAQPAGPGRPLAAPRRRAHRRPPPARNPPAPAEPQPESARPGSAQPGQPGPVGPAGVRPAGSAEPRPRPGAGPGRPAAACHVPVHDTVARWGSDEFAVLVENAGGAPELSEIAERLVGAIAAEPFRVPASRSRSPRAWAWPWPGGNPRAPAPRTTPTTRPGWYCATRTWPCPGPRRPAATGPRSTPRTCTPTWSAGSRS